MQTQKRPRVMAAMSGGVDSAAAVILLLRQGYDVLGATFLQRDGAGKDAGDARAACGKLGIGHVTLDYRAVFRREVIEYFVRSYQRGETPNPCVACNRAIKFGAFLASAREHGCGLIATGHYARAERDEQNGRYRLRRGAYERKDQSYVLYSLGQDALSHVLFPLGACSKEDARRIAEEGGLPLGGKAESQDICFIPDGDYGAFLERYTGEKAPAGDFVGQDGEAIGRHRGLWRYTIGQRKGLGISSHRPLYVTGVDALKNTVTLGGNELLFRGELTARDMSWIDFERLSGPRRFDVKIRYGAKPAPALVTPLADGGITVRFDEPQRAVTPGQSAVLYDGEYVAGGGRIAAGE